MKSILVICATAGAALALMNTAYSEAEEGQLYFSPSVVVVDDDPDRGAEDTATGGQIGIGRVLNEKWNAELLLHVTDFSGSLNPQEHFGVGLDFLRVFRRSERFSPYFILGIGALDVDLENGEDDIGAMYSAGLGVLADLGDSNVALRAEYRRRSDSSTDDTLSDNLFSLGVQIPIGRATPKVVDSDGDGVPDGSDRCPNTPPGTVVGSDGCELDSDGDGVVDSRDKCPGTARGVPVDSDGCPRDSDGDGVTDDKDKCPGTVSGAPVDADGCELDSDNDGVVDRLDECPDSREGAQVDVKGCEIKDEIRLPGVNFATNSDELLAGTSGVLDDAAASLIKNPSIRVEVQGHTDSDGAAAYNQNLSERRANTVREYLVSKGVSSDRLTSRGYGEAQPIADNSTAEGKAANRRVVLSIVAR